MALKRLGLRRASRDAAPGKLKGGDLVFMQTVTLCLVYHADTFTHLARVLNHAACVPEPDAFHAHLAAGLRAQFPDYPCQHDHRPPPDNPTPSQLLYLLARPLAVHAAYLRPPVLSLPECWCLVNLIIIWIYTFALLLPPLRRRLSPRLQLAWLHACFLNDQFLPLAVWGLLRCAPPSSVRHYPPVVCEALGYTALTGLPPWMVYMITFTTIASQAIVALLLRNHGLVSAVPYSLPSLLIRTAITGVGVVAFTALRARIWAALLRFVTPAHLRAAAAARSPVAAFSTQPAAAEAAEKVLLEGPTTPAAEQAGAPVKAAAVVAATAAAPQWGSAANSSAVDGNGDPWIAAGPAPPQPTRHCGTDAAAQATPSGYAADASPAGLEEPVEAAAAATLGPAPEVLGGAAPAATAVCSEVDPLSTRRARAPEHQAPRPQVRGDGADVSGGAGVAVAWPLYHGPLRQRRPRVDGERRSPGEVMKPPWRQRPPPQRSLDSAAAASPAAGRFCDSGGGSGGGGSKGAQHREGGGAGELRGGWQVGSGVVVGPLAPADRQPAEPGGHHAGPSSQQQQQPQPSARELGEGQTQAPPRPQRRAWLPWLWSGWLHGGDGVGGAADDDEGAPAAARWLSRQPRARATAPAYATSAGGVAPGEQPPAATILPAAATSRKAEAEVGSAPLTVEELRAMVAAARAAPYCPDPAIQLTRVTVRLPGLTAAELPPDWREAMLARMTGTLPPGYAVLGLTALDANPAPVDGIAAAALAAAAATTRVDGWGSGGSGPHP